MTPQEFIAKWQRANLTESSAYQQHFLDLCELLGQEKPAAADPDGAWYTFQRGVQKTTGKKGWADVWMCGHFGWEYKGKHKDLDAAYQQLLLYREDLENPPLLVVCDLDRFEIHTNFTGTPKPDESVQNCQKADLSSFLRLSLHFLARVRGRSRRFEKGCMARAECPLSADSVHGVRTLQAQPAKVRPLEYPSPRAISVGSFV